MLMTTDSTGPEHGHPGSTVTVVVVCGFIGCDWQIGIGTAPLEAHASYLDHLDVHDVDGPVDDGDHTNCSCAVPIVQLSPPADDCDQEDGPEAAPQYAGAVHHTTPYGNHPLVLGCCPYNPVAGLYAGDSPEEVATEQARIDRFMAGGNDA